MQNGRAAPTGIAPEEAIASCRSVLIAIDASYPPQVLKSVSCIANLLQAAAVKVPLETVFSSDAKRVLPKRLVQDGVADVLSKLSVVEVPDGDTTPAARLARELLGKSPKQLSEQLVDLLNEEIETVDMKGLVWIEDLDGSSLDLQLGEVQVSASNDDSGIVSVRTDDGRVHQVGADDLKHTCRPTEDLAADLTELTFLHDIAVLHNLRHRYFGGGTGSSSHNQSYYCTFVGNMLVYVNPYAPKGSWISKYDIGDYLNARLRAREATELLPHPYTVADLAYRELLASQHDQAVFVGGESGAGKTEACKFMMQYLLAAQNSTAQKPALPTRRLKGEEKRMAEANEKLTSLLAGSEFVLEALGNASTLNNENSSRFVKYLNLTVGHDGMMLGATVHACLLERTRVCGLTSGKNFHIFGYIERQDTKALKLIDKWLWNIGYVKVQVDAVKALLRAVMLLQKVPISESTGLMDPGQVDVELIQALGCSRVQFADEFNSMLKQSGESRTPSPDADGAELGRYVQMLSALCIHAGA